MIVTKQKSNTRDKPEVTAAPDRMSTVARQLQTEKSPTEKYLQTELSSKESIPRQSRRQRKVSPDTAVVKGKYPQTELSSKESIPRQSCRPWKISPDRPAVQETYSQTLLPFRERIPRQSCRKENVSPHTAVVHGKNPHTELSL